MHAMLDETWQLTQEIWSSPLHHCSKDVSPNEKRYDKQTLVAMLL